MSPKNKKNRLYQVWPKVTRKEMLKFLNSVLYHIKNTSDPRWKKLKNDQDIHEIEEMIVMLAN